MYFIFDQAADGVDYFYAGSERFPDLRFDLTNLVLLCLDCHRFVHSRENTSSEFVLRRES
jgi:hypothetical protein